MFRDKPSTLGLLAPAFTLLTISSLMVASTGLVGDYGSNLVLRHVSSIVIGCLLGVVAYHVPVKLLIKSGPVLLAVSVLSLVLVLAIGDSGGGAKRWINVFGLSVQPAEAVKLAMVIYMASYIERHSKNLKSIKSSVVVPGLVLGLVAFLLLLQPDFGSCVIISGLCGAMLFLFIPLRHSLLAFLVAVSSLGFVMLASPYRLKRLTAFLDPFADPGGSGYQLIQSLVAVGRGGVAGVGLGMSEQKLNYLPAAHTDFLFAIFAEEFGFLGAAAVIFIYLSIGLWAARALFVNREDNAQAALAFGLGGLVLLPALVNMAVVTGIFPTKGLTLPLMSFGGSSMIVSLVSLFMLLGLVKGK